MGKFILAFVAIISIAQAHAESDPIGCAVRTYDCIPSQNGTVKCSWGTDMGYLYNVDLQKTGTSPNYEIWEGNLEGIARGNKYQVSVYQRREPSRKVNYLTADLLVNGVRVTAQAENTVEARYLLEAKNEGIGIHCSMDITPAP